MKYQIVSLAVLALLSSSTRAEDQKKSMIALATDDDQIAAGTSEWNDVGYIQASRKDSPTEELDDDSNIGISSLNKEKNKIIVSKEKQEKAEQIKNEINEREGSEQNQKLFANINEKLRDKSFIEMAVQSSTQRGGSHTDEYEETVEHSDDLAKGDFGGRNTDRMGGWSKDYEDTYNQGGHGTSKSGTNSEIKTQPQHTLPGSWDKYGPTNVPKHFNKGDYQKASAPELTSKSGLVLVYVTVDNDEHATRFVKALFNRNLIAAANQFEGNFERTYLKLGRMATEKGRDKLELVTSSDKVAAVIDYTNQNNPTQYDYPVPDVVAIPIETGNAKFLAWAKKQLSAPEGLHEEKEDHDEDDHHEDEDDH